MNETRGVLLKAALIFVELALLYADVVLFIGFTSANNVEAPFTREIAVSLMCVGDLSSFIMSWVKPRYAGTMLACTTGIFLILSLTAADKHSLQALWLTGGLFVLFKFTLAFLLYRGNVRRN